EAGRDMMIGGICESPLTIRALVGWRDALIDGKMLLRDIIDLDATYGGTVAQPEPGDGAAAPAEAPVEGDGPTPAEGPADGEGGEPGGEAPSDLGGEEGEESTISLAAMEQQLKPQVLDTFEEIAGLYKKLHKLHEQRLTAIQKGDALAKTTERRYDKLKAEMVEKMERVRLNNAR